MDVTQVLEEHHRKVEELFEKYDESDDEEDKQELFTEIADRLVAHASVEEQLFYPAAYKGETEELLREAVEEHLSAKRLVADLLNLDASDEAFDAKMKVLREQIEHHVEEEEEKLFPKVRKQMSAEDREQLGEHVEALHEELLAEEARLSVTDETEEAAPLT